MKTKAMLTAALIAAVALPGAAIARQKADNLAAKADAKPESCVQIIQIRETRVRDDSTIDFYMRGGKIYRNTLPHSCPSLGFEERFAYKTSLSELCSTDIITVLQDAGGLSRGASCGLGQFQEMEKKEAAK
ncbi:hypothetical protein ACFB49_16730 [Sphingomonas sp. DBB INV C78]|uniref:hypothetical protein n=1 Tax=Sphingomonas sp. DBB INV C78 TaxID=3349434 RepID=UPI0036D298D5